MRFLKSLLFFMASLAATAQAQNKTSKNENPVFVDKSGVLRWTKTGAEAAFFGVNYTVPFAYGYRSHRALGKDIEKAIDEDVYHFARLGLDAFRVHVWDTEISDSLGNLKENEHLRLFDYLVSKLKERGIKILITPLAFWGNGYPEPDKKTGSFSSIWNKQQVLVMEAAIKAQERYLQQFLAHVNQYTKKTFESDEAVIALEINNEPHHSGTKKQAAGYIARMLTAVKASGWTKPIFYNISESPTYADAVAASNIDGVSFQWYPTGLVAGHTLQGNYLPNVDVYAIPFDTIAAYKNKARAVYEFDAGDVLASYMYPAMARSFRTAGFQWATQFAYDPMATAYANTEYQTHYLNLAYTPSKAISLMIAAKAFHQLPRLQSYGSYPADSVFKNFRVSYKNSLSEWNIDTTFYYSNTTSTTPATISKLQHIAGVGSSAVVDYTGSGAYFLDKLSTGAWRLEVMPDAVSIRDPFEKASLQKEVTRIEWHTQTMEIGLPDLAQNVFISPLDSGNNFKTQASGNRFTIRPGIYVISNAEKGHRVLKKFTGVIGMAEFSAPKQVHTEPFLVHTPNKAVSAGKPFFISASVVGIDSATQVFAEVHNSSGVWKTIIFQQKTAFDFNAEVPADMVTPGLIEYRILLQKESKPYMTFPGGYIGDPYAWDNYHNDIWQTFVAAENTPLEIFNITTDRQKLTTWNPDWRNNKIEYITADKSEQLVLKATMNDKAAGQIMGWQMYIADNLNARVTELSLLDTLVVMARTPNAAQAKIKIAFITKDAASFAAYVTAGNDWREIRIPLSRLQPDSAALLPRPYPGFLPLWFRSAAATSLHLADAEKLQIIVGSDAAPGAIYNIEIGSVWLKKGDITSK